LSVMDGMKPISNRYHRSGAIDLPVEFAVRQAQMQNSTSRRSTYGKRMWEGAEGCNDVYSICEGEPLFTPKRAKGNGVTCDTGRNPLPVLSSLNGYTCPNSDKIEEKIEQAKNRDNDKQQKYNAYNELRNEFFKNMSYASIAVTKFEYNKIGRQGNQLVGTRGGLNTIFCDADIEAGETVIVDIPQIPTDQFNDRRLDDASHDAPWGFVTWQEKVGVPKQKRTLVIRPMPALTCQADDPNTLKAMREFRRGFFRRGQVVGKCVRGGRAGERIDLTLEGNSVGTWSCHDLC